MANVQEVCQKLVAEIQDCVACGVVDLNTAMLMGVHHTVPYFTQSYLDAVAAASVEMFRGKGVRRVEELLSKHRGREVKNSFDEIFISSETVFHFMKLLREKDALVVLITKKSSSQGMGWAALRNAMDDFRTALG